MLAARGAKLIVNDPAEAAAVGADRPADRVVAEIRAAGGEAAANYGSVMDPSQAAGMIEQAVETFGGIDILVNNAGFLRDRSFAKMSVEDFDAVVKVHLAGAAYCTMAAWPHMRAAGYGRIVMTTSNSGLYGNFGQANYGAAKAGQVGLMNVLKQEGTKYGILVNTICPMAATPMTEQVLDQATKHAFDPADVSAAVAYLCSDSCADTGQIISAAGGYFAAVKMVSSPGAVLPEQDKGSPDAVAHHWREITDFSAHLGFDGAPGEMAHILAKLKSPEPAA